METGVGFVGIGSMGSGMAANLVTAGHRVVVWNRTRERAEGVLGAEVASTPAALARECRVVMICVSDTPDVEEIVGGKDGLLEGLTPGTLLIDHSTISPSATRTLAGLMAVREAAWLDAPVSGGPEGAAQGTLSIMVGGDLADVERAFPYLSAYGSKVIHVGPVGSGQMVKLVNQILVVVNQLASSEALLFAQMGGLELEPTLEAVVGGAAGSWMLANRGPQMIVRDWTPGFTIDLQQKDLRLVLEAADQIGAPLPGTALVFQLYRALQARGLGAEGNHALVKALEEMVGVSLGEATADT